MRCDHCRKPFTPDPRGHGQRFCSGKCRVDHFHWKREQKVIGLQAEVERLRDALKWVPFRDPQAKAALGADWKSTLVDHDSHKRRALVAAGRMRKGPNGRWEVLIGKTDEETVH